MNFHKSHRQSDGCRFAGFTLVEAVVALSVVAVAFTSALAALTKMNSISSISRNYTGAYVVAIKQIDAILSVGPFNPQKTREDGSAQIPPELVLGTHSPQTVPIYNDPPMAGGVLQLLGLGAPPTFAGTMTTTITDVSPVSNTPPYIYRATVTVTYTYRGQNYSFSMNTLRTSDI